MKQKYITVPLAIAYWVLIPTAAMTGDALGGYYMFGALLTIGALSDLNR